MSEFPSISVVMPVYNTALFLKESINSILSQSFSDFEFIIINDGSTDSSSSMIESVSDSRIIFINHVENKGNYVRRNEGCSLARGKYICVMDSDDIAHIDRLRKQYDFMELNPNILAAGSDVYFFSEGSTSSFRRLRDSDKIQVSLLQSNSCTHPSLIIRAEIFAKHGLRYDGKFYYAADYNLMVDISRIGKITNIDEFLLFYRIHSLQISTQNYRKQEEYADQIRLKQLSNLLLAPSEKEQNLHLKLMKGTQLGKEDIKLAENWIKKLLIQNSKHKIYNQEYLSEFLETQLSISKTYLMSVVMPVYNVNTIYLREAVASVLEQSFTNFELLIVDDGSTDQCISVITDFQDERIRIIYNQHDFINTLNRGLSEAKGKYIARMDADDIMLPHRLQIQYDFLESYPDIDICGSWAEKFGQDTGIMRVPTKHTDIVSQLLLGNAMLHPTVIMRKSILDENNYSYDYPFAEDYKLWIDLALKNFRFANIPEVLLRYRRSETQVTRNNLFEMMETTQRIQLEYIEQVMERMIEKDDRYESIFNPLIEATNNELISFESLQMIICQIYSDLLKNFDI